MITCPHCQQQFEPFDLNGSQPKGHTSMTFSRWLETLRGSEAIPASDPAMRYAERVGLPDDFVRLAWVAFQRRYGKGGLGQGKRYKDWRAVFRDALEKNYARLWFVSDYGPLAGQFRLSTAGLQLQMELSRGNSNGTAARA